MTEAIAALMGAVVGGLTALLIDRFAARRSEASETRTIRDTIGALYDKLVDYRERHPEVLLLSREWNAECMKRVYAQESDADRAWAIYYGYVELVLGYCNNVLIAHREILSGASYEHHHRRLARLLVTEHLPIIQDLLDDGKYTSPLIWQFMEQEKKDGWDWNHEHAVLPNLTGASRAARKPNSAPGTCQPADGLPRLPS